jgi:uncharacterized protein
MGLNVFFVFAFSSLLLYIFYMKHQVTVRAYEELNDFLPIHHQKKDFLIEIEPKTPVHVLIEMLHIPFSQVDLILVNGRSVGADHCLDSGDRLSIYPVFETFDISAVTRLRVTPLRRLNFVCDVHLGKLSKLLRMLGIDAHYNKDITPQELIQMSFLQNRIILTKNRVLLKNRFVRRKYWVRSEDSKQQLAEVLSYFDLKGNFAPMSRCLKCNHLVNPVSKDSIRRRVPDAVWNLHETFTICEKCGRIYWKGSHYASMLERISRI